MPLFSRRCLGVALAVCSTAFAEVRSLTILHTNDLHARISSTDNKTGGFAYVAAAIRRERAGCIDCMVLNAGDLVQGTPVSTIFHGLPVYEIANLLGFDVATLGNHDFDYGWPQAKKFLTSAKYPIVTSNLENGKREAFTKPYVILNVNGLRVAVLGAMTDSLKSLTVPSAVGDWHTIPLVATVRKYAQELKARSDLVVVLAHVTGDEELALLKTAPEVPVIVSGHIHRGIPGDALTEGGRVLVRVKGYGEEIGRLELQVDTEKKAPVAWTWKRIPVDTTKIEPDADVARLVQHWEKEVSARVDRPLAVSKRNFTRPEVKRLIEQALRDETGADFALMNQGGVRDIVPKGQLKERHVWDIMPFDNRVVVGKFKGRDLPPVVVGERKIDPDREYTLAVSDYTAANQETKENLQSRGLTFPNDVGLMRDLLLDWFRKKKVLE